MATTDCMVEKTLLPNLDTVLSVRVVLKPPCAKEPFVEVARNINVCVLPQVYIHLVEVQTLKLLKTCI